VVAPVATKSTDDAAAVALPEKKPSEDNTKSLVDQQLAKLSQPLSVKVDDEKSAEDVLAAAADKDMEAGKLPQLLHDRSVSLKSLGNANSPLAKSFEAGLPKLSMKFLGVENVGLLSNNILAEHEEPKWDYLGGCRLGAEKERFLYLVKKPEGNRFSLAVSEKPISDYSQDGITQIVLPVDCSNPDIAGVQILGTFPARCYYCCTVL